MKVDVGFLKCLHTKDKRLQTVTNLIFKSVTISVRMVRNAVYAVSVRFRS